MKKTLESLESQGLTPEYLLERDIPKHEVSHVACEIRLLDILSMNELSTDEMSKMIGLKMITVNQYRYYLISAGLVERRR